MSKKLNQSHVIFKGKTSVFIFLYPFIISFCLLFYSIKNFDIKFFFVLLITSFIVFIIAFLNFYKKEIIITDDFVYLFIRGKKIFKWSIVDEIYLVNVIQNKLGKILNYGTLILVNCNNEMYEYFYLDDPITFKDQLVLIHKEKTKKIDPIKNNEQNLDTLNSDS